jgi:Spy/CpxP family protein refolding chaperone
MDRGKIDATITQLEGSANGMQACSSQALNELHKVLSPAERAALVDKVQAHWEVWQQVNYEPEGTDEGQRARLAELTRELDLSAEQAKQISAAVNAAFVGMAGKFDPIAANVTLQKLCDAFARESFDARELADSSDAQVATYGSMRKARFYETVTPLLTPEQRISLAGQLREYASQPSPTASAN